MDKHLPSGEYLFRDKMSAEIAAMRVIDPWRYEIYENPIKGAFPSIFFFNWVLHVFRQEDFTPELPNGNRLG